MRDVLEAWLASLRGGRPAALVTVVRSTGSTPRTAGARMLVREDGSTVGTVGGGAFEALATRDALDLLAAGEAGPVTKRYVFTEEGEDALGMACGGNAEVWIERVGAGPPLVIYGCGHVGIALARLAGTVGFDCTLVDDREEACEAARRLVDARVSRCDPEWTELPPLDARSYAAIVTRCHRTDRLALRSVARSPARYVGLIGSRRKKGVIFRELVERDGVPPSLLERVRCPIGLPIGGETPEEIAVSIVAELQQERHRKD